MFFAFFREGNNQIQKKRAFRQCAGIEDCRAGIPQADDDFFFQSLSGSISNLGWGFVDIHCEHGFVIRVQFDKQGGKQSDEGEE